MRREKRLFNGNGRKTISEYKQTSDTFWSTSNHFLRKIKTLSFGDRTAAAFFEIAIRQTASLNQHIDPLADIRITEDRYVDDYSLVAPLLKWISL